MGLFDSIANSLTGGLYGAGKGILTGDYEGAAGSLFYGGLAGTLDAGAELDDRRKGGPEKRAKEQALIDEQKAEAERKKKADADALLAAETQKKQTLDQAASIAARDQDLRRSQQLSGAGGGQRRTSILTSPLGAYGGRKTLLGS